MNCWTRLAIEPTTEQRAIKKAYAAQLKLIDQDADPDGFIQLRQAYEQAQQSAEYLQYQQQYTDEEDQGEDEERYSTSEHKYPDSLDSDDEQYQVNDRGDCNQDNTDTDNDIFQISLAQHFQILRHKIEQQDIDFNLNDALHAFKHSLEHSPLDEQAQYQLKMMTLLQQYDLEDFIEIIMIPPQTAAALHRDPSFDISHAAQSQHDQQYSQQHDQDADIDDAELITHRSSSEIAPRVDFAQMQFYQQVDHVAEALWAQRIDNEVFSQFKNILEQQHQLNLTEQLYLQDEWIEPLAQLEQELRDPNYQRFLALWRECFHEEQQHYDQSYYHSQLQFKVEEYLKHRHLWDMIPTSKHATLERLSGEKSFHPVQIFQLQAALGKALPGQDVMQHINRLGLTETDYNPNYALLNSLNHWKSAIWSNVVITLATYPILQSLKLNTFVQLLLILTLSMLYYFVLQAPLQSWIVSFKNRYQLLAGYCLLWLISAFALLSLAQHIQSDIHLIFTYLWVIATVVLFCTLQLLSPTGSNQFFQSQHIKSDQSVMCIGLIALLIGFGFGYYVVAMPERPWVVFYSLIPMGFLLLSDSFKHLGQQYLRELASSTSAFKDKVKVYIWIVLILLIVAANFIYVFMYNPFNNFNYELNGYFYLACLSMAAIVFVGIKVDLFSTVLKYSSYVLLMIATSFSFFLPLLFIYWMYLTFKARPQY